MLRLRVITALILFLILVGALWLGPRAFGTFVAIAFGAAIFEWLRLAHVSTTAAIVGGVAGAIPLAVLQWLRIDLPSDVLRTLVAAAFVAWLGVAAWLVRTERTHDLMLRNGAVALLLPLLLGAAWFALIALYRQSALYLFSTLAVVWIADIAAYFAGRAFGKTKLAPHISPGKTWVGVGGAVVAVVVVAFGVWLAWPQGDLLSNVLFARSPVIAVVMLALLVAISIVGDLFESLMKRHAGVKDSSALLPGHGGVLDRIDALLPVLPAAVLIGGLL